MANPFTSLAPFGGDLASQVSFFDNIKTIINNLEKADPIFIESTTVPTQVQFESAYLAASVGNVLPIPTSQEFIWINQGVIQGEYRAIDDLFANINDVSMQRSNPLSGFSFLMSNGDIIISNQTDYSNLITTALKKYDRRTGQLQAVTLTVDMPVGQFWSKPDGTSIVYSKLDGGTIRQIYTAPYPALTPETKLTTSATTTRNPSWQNGKIAYLENVGGNWTIKIMNENGSSQTTVLATGIAIATNVYLALSPDATKIIYTKYVSGNTEVWMVNANGTGNARFINPLDYVNDNPDGGASTTNTGDAPPMMIPNWSADGLWILYGRRRKNVATTLSERWYNYSQSDDSNRFDLTYSYFEQLNGVSKNWFTKNLYIPQSLWGGSPTALESYFMLIPLFTAPIYGGKAYLVASQAYPSSTLVQLYPVTIAANQADGYKSTGKVYKTSQHVPDRADFELIRTDTAVGTETAFGLSYEELKNFDHIMIVFCGAAASAALATGRILMNEDNTIGNYYNEALLASTTILRAYTGVDDGFRLSISGQLGTNITEFVTTIYDIQSTDSFKTGITETFYSGSTAAFAIANYFEGDIMSIWKSVAAVESMRLTTSLAVGAGTTVSFYGLRGTARSDKDM